MQRPQTDTDLQNRSGPDRGRQTATANWTTGAHMQRHSEIVQEVLTERDEAGLE